MWISSFRVRHFPGVGERDRISLGSPFQIGDEGYLSKYKDGERFEISFRKGTVVGRTSARDLNKLKEFAQFIVESIPPK